MPRTILNSLVTRLAQWHSVARSRGALARVPADRLADIGLTVGQARAEAARPFWVGAPEPRATSCRKPAVRRTLRAFGN